MPVPVTMPKFGVTMTGGTVARWLVSEGDRVTQDQPLAEIETEKIVNELVAPADGVIAGVQRMEGESADVTAIMAWILQDGESVDDIPSDKPASRPAAPASAPKTAKRVPAAAKPSQAPSSPSARRLARELGVDVAVVIGTGPGGRITKEDVQRAADSPQPSEPEPSAPADGVTPWSPMRQRVIQSVTTAASIPQLTLFSRADATQLRALRERHPDVLYEDGILFSVARTLRDHPYVNASFTEDGAQLHDPVNIGLAVAVERGLMVPVIHNADRLALTDIASARQQLVERVRSRKTSSQDLSDGTFTITNLGMYPVDRFVALLNPPEAAILSVGRLQDQPVVAHGEIVVRPIIELGLTVDHRVLDGAEAAAFLSDVVARIESLTAEA